MRKIEVKDKKGREVMMMATYDPDSIKDIAHSITDWLDGLRKDDIYDVADQLDRYKCLNEKGKNLLEELYKLKEKEYEDKVKEIGGKMRK